MKFNLKDKLVKIREDKNLTQVEISELLGMSPAAYGRLERGETLPDIDQIINLSQKLNLPISDFFPDSIIIQNNQNTSGDNVDNNLFVFNKNDDSLKIENQFLKEKISLLEELLMEYRKK